MKTNGHFTTNIRKKLWGKVSRIGLTLLMFAFTTTLTAQSVYISGYYNDGSSSKIAQIWEGDGTGHNLTNGNRTAIAMDVFIYDNDEYVAGYESNGVNYIAKIWKNGTAQNLTDGTESAYAQSVFVYDGDVYAVGFEYNGTNHVAKLWKNGTVQNLTDGSKNAKANSVFVSDGDVYVAGIEYSYSVDGNNVDSVIKVWKNGTAHDLTDGNNYVGVESIFIDNGDTYVAGREYNGTNHIAKLWKNGNAQNLTDGGSQAAANSVFVSNGDIYVAGYDGAIQKLWKNGVEEPLYYNTNLDGGKAYSVYVSGSDVYVAGILTESNGNQACHYASLWKNGEVEFTSPSPGCSEDTAMYSVVVDDGQLGVETIENQETRISLYPTPVQSILHIETKSEDIQKIDLLSITGQHLKSWQEKTEINLSQFVSGNYFIKITTQNGNTVTKQVIKN